MSNGQKQFTVTAVSLMVVGIVAMVAFVALAYIVPNQTLAMGAVLGALAVAVGAPIVGLYTKVGHVEAVVLDGQKAAAERTEGVKEKVEAVAQRVEATEGMPLTPEKLREFILEVVRPVAEESAELAVKKYCDAQARLRGAVT